MAGQAISSVSSKDTSNASDMSTGRADSGQTNARVGISSTLVFGQGSIQNGSSIGLPTARSRSPEVEKTTSELPSGTARTNPSLSTATTSSLTKRVRDIVENTPLKAFKTSSTSSPMTTRSLRSALKTASITLHNVKDALVKKEHHFLSAMKFAVVGASNDEEKYGYKIMKYLQGLKKDVVPINPNEKEVLGIKCLKSIAELPDPAHTSVSFVVQPEVMLNILKSISQTKLTLFALWLQPGVGNAHVLEFIEKNGMGDHCIYATGGSGSISTLKITTSNAGSSSGDPGDTTGQGCRDVIANPSLIGKMADEGESAAAAAVSSSISPISMITSGSGSEGVTTTGTVTTTAHAFVTSTSVQTNGPCLLVDGPQCLAAMDMGHTRTQCQSPAPATVKGLTQCDELPGLA